MVPRAGSFRYLRSAVVVLVVALAAPRLCADDNTRNIAAGETQAVVSGADPIVITGPPARGTAAVKEESGPPKRYTLLYTAPATDSVFTESVQYTNPTEKTFTVTVTPSDAQIYSEAFRALFIVFVVALLLESGLAVLFNWRPCVVYFDGRGVKTVVSVVVAYLFVRSFDLDIVTRLVNIYSQRTPPFASSFAGYLVTALVIAGGSAAVNNILVALGFRSVRTADQVRPKPAQSEGWISVTLDRAAAVGPVDVLIGDPAGGGPPVAGTIWGGKRLSPFWRLFVRDPNRFPMSGGFAVPARTVCAVHLEGRDAAGTTISAKWGPKTIAAGAILDLELKL